MRNKNQLERIANYCYERSWSSSIDSNHFWLNMMVAAIAAKKRM